MEKTVGVIGGLGPEATVDFYAKLIAKTGAATDQEHLHVIINSNPKVPDRTASLNGGPSSRPLLVDGARTLEAAGADFLVMVCNTAHAYAGDIRAAVDVPFLSILDASVEAAVRAVPQLKKVGILATDGCLDASLYQAKFAEHGVASVVPNPASQADVMRLIFAVKAGDTGASARAEMQQVAARLVADGAQVIVGACTEVPLILAQDAVAVPLINSTDALVDATLAFARAV